MTATKNTVRRVTCTSCKREATTEQAILPFYESRAPGSEWAKRTCAVCRYAPIAHDRFAGRLMDSVGSGTWPRGVDPHEFIEHPGADVDTYYCGCRGWE